MSVALAEHFAGFEVPSPRGVVIVSMEDDREEFHRRVWALMEGIHTATTAKCSAIGGGSFVTQ